MGNNRTWHPSFGWLTRNEMDKLNAMKDDSGEKRRQLLKAAEKEAKQIPFPPLKTMIALTAAMLISTPAAADGATLVCPAGTFRAVEVTGFDGTTATVEVSCRPLPSPDYKQYEHPTFVQNAPPLVTDADD